MKHIFTLIVGPNVPLIMSLKSLPPPLHSMVMTPKPTSLLCGNMWHVHSIDSTNHHVNEDFLQNLGLCIFGIGCFCVTFF